MASSSSSSSLSGTIVGTVTPTVETKDIDLERSPLLGWKRTTSSPPPSSFPTILTRLRNTIHAWLLHQPPPLPLIHRTLPSNGTTLTVLLWLALNLTLHLYRLPLHWDFFFIFADRTGCVFVVNLPLLYLLSAKNQPLRLLTGYSYEALNIFHRRVGELLCVEAIVHAVGMVLWQFVLAREWLVASRSAYVYFTHPIILCGLGALVAYEVVGFTSLASFRRRWYEVFLAVHVVLQAGGLGLLWFHYPTSRVYVAVSAGVWVVDRVVWRLGLKRVGLEAEVVVLDRDTYVVSADWEVPRPEKSGLSWWPLILSRPRRLILHGWEPTDHVFLTVPALGRSHALQAHPFTIASAAPGRWPYEKEAEDDDDDDKHQPTTPVQTHHAHLTLLIRAHSGFTRDLLNHARTHYSHQPLLSHPHPLKLQINLDGPYGSPHALSMLRASRRAVLVAGGSGIAVVFSLAWALLPPPPGIIRGDGNGRRKKRRRKVHLLWVTHSREHRAWIPRAQLEELVARGLDLVMPEPTVEAGRPDVEGLVGAWISDTEDRESDVRGRREVGVVVSGPDGLNRMVRNVCAREVGKGRRVRVAVEKFGW
ncbi:hypothetical protein B0J18DRAFT_421648 [Chaetomium sp. MPI-SDFR-AT-0129]|nr:hypothetical protein B0J18DRAFT_421648 [Chaetomium sp. MPI-SDFR-AT-0129]